MAALSAPTGSWQRRADGGRRRRERGARGRGERAPGRGGGGGPEEEEEEAEAEAEGTVRAAVRAAGLVETRDGLVEAPAHARLIGERARGGGSGGAARGEGVRDARGARRAPGASLESDEDDAAAARGGAHHASLRDRQETQRRGERRGGEGLRHVRIANASRGCDERVWGARGRGADGGALQ